MDAFEGIISVVILVLALVLGLGLGYDLANEKILKDCPVIGQVIIKNKLVTCKVSKLPMKENDSE